MLYGYQIAKLSPQRGGPRCVPGQDDFSSNSERKNPGRIWFKVNQHALPCVRGISNLILTTSLFQPFSCLSQPSLVGSHLLDPALRSCRYYFQTDHLGKRTKGLKPNVRAGYPALPLREGPFRGQLVQLSTKVDLSCFNYLIKRADIAWGFNLTLYTWAQINSCYK